MPAPLRAVAVATFLALCAAARAQTLTVNGGALGSESAPGATNHVWADPAPPDQVFDTWVGDTGGLANPGAWHSTVVMPAAPATITATYRPSAEWTPATYTLNGRAAGDPGAVALIYHFPAEAPVGLIFLFHGTGGSASSFFEKVENFMFTRDAVARGYAVAALDSTNRVARQWNASAAGDNVDVLNVQAAIDYFTAAGLLTAETPRFAVGMSNGGGFAPKPAYFLGFRACAIWCAAGAPAPLFDLTMVPTVWNLARNDDLYDHTQFLGNASANLAALNARGVGGKIRERPPSPVYPRRFLRVPGLTEADSQAIYDNLRAGGYLDANGYLLADPAASGWERTLSPAYAAKRAEIGDQLACCYTSHQFFSDLDDKTLKFFTNHRLPKVVP